MWHGPLFKVVGGLMHMDMGIDKDNDDPIDVSTLLKCILFYNGPITEH